MTQKKRLFLNFQNEHNGNFDDLEICLDDEVIWTIRTDKNYDEITIILEKIAKRLGAEVIIKYGEADSSEEED